MADAQAGSEIRVPITKGKGFVTINTADLDDATYAEVLLQGLKVLANRGASKITKETYSDPAELQAAAMAMAEQQVELIKTGKIKFTGAKAAGKSKESGKVMTVARNLARNVVKDAIKAAGGKISHYEPKDITAAANELLKSDPTLIEQAKAQIAALEATPSHTVDIKSLISVSDKRVKAANAKAAADKADRALSAKQAGKVAPRKKGTQPTA